MHNVKRTFKKKTREDQKRALVKIFKFKGLAKLLLKQQANRVYTPEALVLTEKMLVRNCDFAVVWNYRRQILLHLFSECEGEDGIGKVRQLEEKELALTKRCIAQENPKSYCTWHHRRWIVTRGNCNLQNEISLCTEFLKLDERNFHCWNYRRWVIVQAGVAAEDEFDYTTEKIQENFSNFSSLHYRLSLFDAIIARRSSGENDAKSIAAELLKEEMDTVQNAIYTEPDDQSCWMYVRCLIKWAAGTMPSDLTTPRDPPIDPAVLAEVVEELEETCRSLLEEESDCKWALLCLFEVLGNSWGGSVHDVSNTEILAERRDCLQKLMTVDTTHHTYYTQRLRSLEKP